MKEISNVKGFIPFLGRDVSLVLCEPSSSDFPSVWTLTLPLTGTKGRDA
jgi:hypothetical protein